MDDLDQARREMLPVVNATKDIDGPTWTTDEMARDFDVLGFLAPFVVVCRKSDGQKGSLLFKHNPRVYFGWQEDR